MFDPGKPFLDKLIKLSRKLRTWHKKGLWLLIADTSFYIKKNINLNLSLRSETEIRKVLPEEAISGQTH